ncbi:YceI family protein [Mucilaginibacter dorajii]|uniref:YceI family protein n=1 Tax=Mucilaginibacter dorajii TaxID=692994 RepID=A0ABP7PN58_9SPHI|nr:YceI family protein [Mucilaginibacter dorajii]MCS3736345.1 polyisoprenoid-binding protein YceI [Mucilaginibacter dorajii]
MKKIILLALMICAVKYSHAQYKPVEDGSVLKFTIKNLGFGVDGTFGGFQGNINFDPQNPDKSSFDVTVNASTVNTSNSLRDEHLRAENYFDVKNNPRIRLYSTRIIAKNGAYSFTGDLTIKGKTQFITFPFTAAAITDGFLFKGSFKIKRKDFGVGGTSTIADELEVSLSVIAKKG